MGSFKLYATLAGVMALATTAQAADLLPPAPPAPVPVDVGGGWYLRGDVGVSHYEGGKFSSVEPTTAKFSDQDFGSGGFAGAGIGYQFNNWFRADVTGEYRFSTGVKAHDRDSWTGGSGRVSSIEGYQGDYSAAVVMLNGYFDLGTWYGITPFVGAGVGWAENYLHAFETSTQNVYLDHPDWNNGVSGGTIRDAHKGNLAWALHAGLGYDVTPNLKLEIAYRYLNLGDAKTGVVDCFCGETHQGYKAKELESHDIKIGMRWLLGAPVPVADYGAPIIRKY